MLEPLQRKVPGALHQLSLDPLDIAGASYTKKNMATEVKDRDGC